MYLTRCKIENIKCFEQIELEFQNPEGKPQMWNVIVGENGSGKSTILQLIALGLLDGPAAFGLLPRPFGWVRGGGYDNGKVEISAKKDRLRRSYKIIGEKSIDELTLAQGPFLSTFTEITLSESHESHIEMRDVGFAGGYGPLRRLSGGTSDIEAMYKSRVRESFFVTLFREDAHIPFCIDWLKELHYTQLNTQSHQTDSNAKQILDTIFNLINNSGILPNNTKIIEISPQGVFFQTLYAEKIPIEHLSDGYRSILTLLIDLIRSICYSVLQKNKEVMITSEQITSIEGIVLIDEPNSHLHPMWQRQIGYILQRSFPNIQFIVATHSPFIVQEADDHGLYVLRSDHDNDSVQVYRDIPSVRGWRTEQILATVFETVGGYSVESGQILKEYRQLALLHQQKRLSPEQQERFIDVQIWIESYLTPPGLPPLTREHYAQVEANAKRLTTLLERTNHD